MKIVMTAIQPEKNRKIPNLITHKSERKDCAIANVKNKFTVTVILWPADLVSKGKISLGTVQPRGPHEYPNAATKRQMKTTTTIE
ncbi:hypothetical protein RDI58_017178 [Solanum bulbocastanum]|uniref:Uncharacterized protein n=1 Tax=Solanum bulbocastanum TaxID=147425 RepID=A0AAN8TBV4_SOLBU